MGIKMNTVKENGNKFKKWFGYQEMKYTGGTVISDIQPVHYDACYYDRYKFIYEECFYAMRKDLELVPYNCCDDAESLSNNKDNIFILLQGEALIGSVVLKKNEIDDLIVNKKFQRQGYGRALLHFAIHQLQNIGVEEIIIGATLWNKNAILLYEKEGFVRNKICELYRNPLTHISIETTKEADAKELVEAQDKAFYSDFTKYGVCPGYGKTEESMRNSIRAAEVYKIVKDSKIIGDIIVSNRGDGDYHLSGLCVIPEYEGQGIGQAALLFLQDRYPEATHWFLETPADKERNHRFYEKNGFNIANTLTDRDVPLVVFEKNINK